MINRKKALSTIFILIVTFITLKGQQLEEIELEFIQGETTYHISDLNTTLELQKDSFSLVFNTGTYNPEKKLFNAVQIAVGTESNFLEQMKEGPKEDISYYSPGTGLAEEYGKSYSYVYVSTDAHHYIYYEDDENKRGEIVEKKENGIVRLSWTIKSLTINDKKVQLPEIELEKLYFVVFADKNLNQIVEEDEYHLITLNFK